MVALALLSPLTLAFALPASRAHLSRVRAPAPIAFNDALADVIEGLESNVLNETAWDAALQHAHAWIAEPTHQHIDTLGPNLSVDESDESYTFKMSGLQAVAAADVEVSVEDGTLTISGETTRENEDGSSFRRSVSVPFDADNDIVSTLHGEDEIVVLLPKVGEASALGDELLAKAVAEGEALAAESPRFARWARAHGYLTDGDGPVVDDGEASALDDVEDEALFGESPRFARWARARGYLADDGNASMDYDDEGE